MPSTFDRDLSPAFEAIKFYQELIRKYPNSDFSKGSEEKIRICNEKIERKEKYIADFYFKTGEYNSARYRFLEILKSFTDPQLRGHSIIRILESSLMLKDLDGCKKYYEQYKTDISEERANEANKILKKCQ